MSMDKIREDKKMNNDVMDLDMNKHRFRFGHTLHPQWQVLIPCVQTFVSMLMFKIMFLNNTPSDSINKERSKCRM